MLQYFATQEYKKIHLLLFFSVVFPFQKENISIILLSTYETDQICEETTCRDVAGISVIERLNCMFES